MRFDMMSFLLSFASDLLRHQAMPEWAHVVGSLG
jgi:hypothetical protein